jgi:hypothetical protein
MWWSIRTSGRGGSRRCCTVTVTTDTEALRSDCEKRLVQYLWGRDPEKVRDWLYEKMGSAHINNVKEQDSQSCKIVGYDGTEYQDQLR